jgi:hypothetical protein
MMEHAIKTLNEMLEDTPDLLNFVTVPQSASELNANTLKQAIIRRCGDVEPYYQRPLQFQLFGAFWFNSHSFLFAHALAIWDATYNPIENYDRSEEETITDTSSGTRSGSDTHSGTDATTTSGTASGSDAHSGTDSKTTGGTDTETETHGGTTGKTTSTTRENKIAGFDSQAYAPANQETETGSETTTHGETVNTSRQTSGTESLQHGETITKSEQTSGTESLQHGHKIDTTEETTGENERTRTMRIHGNIGVTTSQQMLESEMELGNKFWIYDYIASAFESDNFITCYNSYWGEFQWR